jgi:DUF1365 family protein
VNLLTVYFCYRKDNRRLWIVVLEVRIQRASPMFEASPCMTLQIHNTFGECHVHILEVGRNEEAPNAK